MSSMYDPVTDAELEGPQLPRGSLVEAVENLYFAGRELRRAIGIRTPIGPAVRIGLLAWMLVIMAASLAFPGLMQ